MSDTEQTSTTGATEIVIGSKETSSLRITGNIPNLHDDPQKIHQLLDLLELPEGTVARVTTEATSTIVR